MIFPWIIQSGLSEELIGNWKSRFCDNWDRSIREAVWRRHQCPENAELSGWRSPEDMRRRVLHYRDKYSLVGGDFALTHAKIVLSFFAPYREILDHHDRVMSSLRGWVAVGERTYRNGDLSFAYASGWSENGYAEAAYEVTSVGYDLPRATMHREIRKVSVRGTPQEIGVKDLEKWLPAQVELGCGASIEAGVPPLNYLHEHYNVFRKDGTFVFCDDVFLSDFLKDPEKKYRAFSKIHHSCLTVAVSPFYKVLKELHNKGVVVGPIITNNFDGLAKSAGLPEFCMRQFDKDWVYPEVKFHPAAKSLLVIGSHADRRGTVGCARRAGLRVIHVDPEGYGTETGFVPYPIEAPTDEDFIIRKGATEAICDISLQVNASRYNSGMAADA